VELPFSVIVNNLEAINPLYTQQAVIHFLILCVMSTDTLLSSFIIEPKQGKIETRIVCVCVRARACACVGARVAACMSTDTKN
jgi:hypothetical protein